MKIPLFKIYWDKDDVKAVTDAIKSGRDWAIGPKIEKLENKISDYVGTKYAVMFNSGTSALHAIMLAFDIGPEDEVIVPSFTFIATANSPLFVGAKPVFAEIEDETYGLEPRDVEKRITKKTKAVMPIHYGGQACRIRELKKITRKHNLILIEDAAESLGAKIGSKKAGTFGEVSMFSFCAPKVITSGEGGVAATDSKKIYEKLKLIRSHGRAETKNYFSSSQYMDYITLGYNFRMSNLTAALAFSQLKKINKIIKLRRKKAAYLTKKLSAVKELVLPQSPKNYFHLYQMYTIKIKNGKKTRDALKDYLNNKGVMAKVYYPPVHLTSFYRNSFGYKKGDLPITERISEKVLTLPMYPELAKKEIDYMAKEIQKFFKK